MENQKQAIRIRNMLNRVIVPLIGAQHTIPGGVVTLDMIEFGVKKINERLYPYSDMACDRIVDYLVYHLYLRRESKYRFTVGDLFGDYAIDKYRRQFMSENGKSGINYYINQWLDEDNLTRQILTAMIEEPKPHKMSKFIYMESEELIKKRFLNTDMGYMLCQTSTTGWAPRSATCQQCKNIEQCINVTSLKYPELVRLRRQDYENDKKK